MVCWRVRNSNHANSWAAFLSVIDILRGNTIRRGLAYIAQPFFFDPTCDVISGPDANETRFPSTNRSGLSKAVQNFQIGTAVGAQCKAYSTPSLRCWLGAPLEHAAPAAGKICRPSAGGLYPIQILDPPLLQQALGGRFRN